MPFYLLYFAIFLIITAVSEGQETYKLNAVSNSIIAQELYWRVRHENPRASLPTAMDSETKSKICHHITGSPFFIDVQHEKRVCVHEIYDRLRHRESTLFSLLEEPTALTPDDDTLKIYPNNTRLIYVNFAEDEDDETVQEYAFMCLTYSSEDEEEKVYRVSREYNLGDTPNPYIAGRFIFAYVTEDDLTHTEVHAIAEEPAKSMSTPGAAVESLYFRNRVGKEPEKKESDDPICALDHFERLRLCTLVLSASDFEGEVKFVPQYEYVDESACERKEISFQDERVRSQTDGECYEEWMIRCRPREYYSIFQTEYFISRVYGYENEVFLYHRGVGSRVVLENLFGNARLHI